MSDDKLTPETMRALEMDGEKLRGLTGRDHGPFVEERKTKMDDDPFVANEPRRIEQQVVFAVTQMRDGLPLLMLGVPREAWLYMKDGKTHTFDLTKAGMPLRLMMFGAPSHKQILDNIQKHNTRIGVVMDDQRNKDFAIKPDAEIKRDMDAGIDSLRGTPEEKDALREELERQPQLVGKERPHVVTGEGVYEHVAEELGNGDLPQLSAEAWRVFMAWIERCVIADDGTCKHEWEVGDVEQCKLCGDTRPKASDRLALADEIEKRRQDFAEQIELMLTEEQTDLILSCLRDLPDDTPDVT